jgi:hypothetical protein
LSHFLILPYHSLWLVLDQKTFARGTNKMESDAEMKAVPVKSEGELDAQASPNTSKLPNIQPPVGSKPAAVANAIGEAGPAGQGGAVPAEPAKYRIISIPQPDGTIKKFKRPILEDKDSSSAATQPSKVGSTSNISGAIEYTIVVIPQPDGSMKKFRRPIVEGSGSSNTARKPPKKTSTESSTEAAKGLAKSPPTTASGMAKDLKAGAKPITATPAATATECTKPEVLQAEQENTTGMDHASLQRALDQQKQNMRQRKMSGFRSKLTRGLATAIASSIPAFEISSHQQDGDIEMSDDDYSDNEDIDDIDDNHDHGHGEYDQEGHHEHGKILLPTPFIIRYISVAHSYAS